MTQKKQVERPEAVKIGPHWYNIAWMAAADYDVKFPADSDGCTAAARCVIAVKVNTDCPESHYQGVLLHEVQHAVWHACGLSLTADWNAGSDGDVEERVIAQTSAALLSVLQDNPQLVKYLTAPGHERR